MKVSYRQLNINYYDFKDLSSLILVYLVHLVRPIRSCVTFKLKKTSKVRVTLSSINNHFNTMKEKDLGKHCENR